MYLRQSPKLRRKRFRSHDNRGRMTEKRHIAERPRSVQGRRLIHRDPVKFKMINADNGTEFHQPRAIEADRKARFNSANPYH